MLYVEGAAYLLCEQQGLTVCLLLLAVGCLLLLLLHLQGTSGFSIQELLLTAGLVVVQGHRSALCIALIDSTATAAAAADDDDDVMQEECVGWAVINSMHTSWALHCWSLCGCC